MTDPSVADLHSFEALVAALAECGCVAPEAEATLLRAVTTDPRDLADLVTRRARGVAVEVLVGYADFCGLRVVVRPGVFVPRPRTELLARVATTHAAAVDRPVVADVCCGTGAIASVVASRVRGALVIASDLEPTAVACARENAAAYGFDVVAGGLCDGLPGELRGNITVLVANVPHVPSDELAMMPRDRRAHEPRIAHDGGPDGLDVLRRLADQARSWLAPSGVLLVELAERQVAGAVAALAERGYAVTTERDEDERTAVVVARQSSSARTSASSPSR